MTYNALIRGEDGTLFTVEVEAPNVSAASDDVAEMYPEGTVEEIFDPRVRAQEHYERAQRMYDDPSYDDYDY